MMHIVTATIVVCGLIALLVGGALYRSADSEQEDVSAGYDYGCGSLLLILGAVLLLFGVLMRIFL